MKTGELISYGASAFLSGSESSTVDSPTDKGTNIFFYVSGSITGSPGNTPGSLVNNEDKRAVFGGDVVISGSLTVEKNPYVINIIEGTSATVTVPPGWRRYVIIARNPDEATTINLPYNSQNAAWHPNQVRAGDTAEIYFYVNDNQASLTISPTSPALTMSDLGGRVVVYDSTERTWLVQDMFTATSAITLSDYIQLGETGSLSYPATGLVRIASPATAGNRSIITMEPNAGGTDLDVLKSDTSNNTYVNGNEVRIQTNATTRLTSTDSILTSTNPIEILGGTYATTGAIRLPKDGIIMAVRNAGNTADLTTIWSDATDNVYFGSSTNNLRVSGSLVYVNVDNTGSLRYSGINRVHWMSASVGIYPYLEIAGSSSATNLASTGSIRFQNNTVMLAARNAGNTSNITISTDSSSNLIYDSGGTPAGHIWRQGGFTRAGLTTTFSLGTSVDFAFAGTVSSTASGDIRCANNRTIISARNAGNSGDILVLTTDASDGVKLGGTNAVTAIIDGTTFVSFRINGSAKSILSSTTHTFNIPNLTFEYDVSSPIVSQTTHTSDAATSNLTIKPQHAYATATGTNRTPGSLVINLGAPTNSGTTEAGVIIQRNGSLFGQIGPYTGAGYSAIWLGPGITPSSTNFAFLGEAASHTYLNVPTGGTIHLAFQGSYANAGSVDLTAASGLTWSALSAAPGLNQVLVSTNGATAATLTIGAQNATGTTSTGGKLLLRSGTGTSISGSVDIYCGADLRLSASASGIEVYGTHELYATASKKTGAIVGSIDLGSTTSSTPTSLGSVTIPTNTGGILYVQVTANKSDGSVVFNKMGKVPYAKPSGVLTLGTVNYQSGSDSVGTTTNMDFTLTGSSNNVLVTGTGLAATTFRWGAAYEIDYRTTSA